MTPPDTFSSLIVASGLPEPALEYRFHPSRRWRFDYAWPAHRLALEIEGGTWNGGRHVRGKGYERDCEKYNAAALMGWTVLRVTTAMLRDGRALTLLEEAFADHLLVRGKRSQIEPARNSPSSED